MKTSEKEGKIGKYRLCILCKVQIQKQEKIHMQHTKNMQCNNNWFRFIYSFNVRDAREKKFTIKNSQMQFFLGGELFDFTIILGAKEYLHICNIGTFVGLPFLSNLEVFVF